MYREEKLHINEKRNRRVQRKKRSAKRRIWNIAATVAFSALLFGVVEGGTSYAVEQYLIGQNNETATANETSSTTDTNVLSLSATTYSNTAQLSVTEIASSGLSSVVSVTNVSVQEVEDFFGRHEGNRSRQFSQSQTEETVSCGSGIILYEENSELYMLTNYHVVEGASSLSVTFVDDETYEAALCGYDANIDLAVLKVDISALSESTYSQIRVVEIGDSDALEVGEQVVAIGNAYVSSAQEYDGNIIIDSGMQGIFGEYDSNGNLIQEFQMTLADEYIYRVYKYDFRNFYFAG